MAKILEMLKKPLTKEIIGLFMVGYTLNSIANARNLYIPSVGGEFDCIMHTLGGISVSVSFLWLYFFSGFFKPESRKYTDFFRISLLSIIFVAFSWEIYEIITGVMQVGSAGYAYDTFLDVTFGILGSVIGTIYSYNRQLTWQKINSKINLTANLQSMEESALRPEQI